MVLKLNLRVTWEVVEGGWIVPKAALQQWRTHTHTHTHKPPFPHSLCSLSSSIHYLFSLCVPFVYIIITSLPPRTPPLLVRQERKDSGGSEGGVMSVCGGDSGGGDGGSEVLAEINGHIVT